MFSGIIEKVGTVMLAQAEGPARRLMVASGLQGLTLGESVAVNGVCLTVVRHERGETDFFVSAETLDRSNLAMADVGDAVNLERAVTLDTRLSGHLVQGHVDGKARMIRIVPIGEARSVELSLPTDLRAYCVEKGSIALNGVSLTLNHVSTTDPAGRFSVRITLIPHTWEHTNLRRCAVGDEVNVEVDVMAKYVERLCHAYLTPSIA